MKYRMSVLIAFLMLVIFAFTWVLYQEQMVKGSEYLAQSNRKITEIQTVEASRGEILDRYGRVLVSNRLTYYVSLDLARMGSEEERHAQILQLIEICEQEELAWTDTLPISQSAPFVYTTESARTTARNHFSRFLVNRSKVKGELHQPLRDAIGTEEEDILAAVTEGMRAKDMMEYLRTYYNISEDYSQEQARKIIGVLYELELRRRDISTSAYRFAEDVTHDFIARVKELSLPGVTISPTTTRVYHTEYAAQLLGRVGPIQNWDYYKERGYSMDAIVGVEGVEATFEDYLRGTSGTKAVETNQAGKIMHEEYIVEPQPGNNVFLTLDINAQAAAEQILENSISNFAEGKGAVLIALDVKNGGVLASASYPTYTMEQYLKDYHALLDDPLKPLLNRVTQETYAPGSTFKMVSAVAALEQGLITPSIRINCTGRYTYYKNIADQPQCWIYRQHQGVHGPLNVSEALVNSCNIFFYDIGRRLGIETIAEYATKFGLGQPTGIEMTEALGVAASRAYTESLGQTWYEGNTMYAAIGQENNRFTPLQLANYIATIANGGSHYSVHLLQEVKSNDYRSSIFKYEAELRDSFSISETSMKAVHAGLRGVVTSLSPFRNCVVDVAGKTGSAQIASDKEANALFVAFAPYDDPEIAICVVIEEGGAGSQTAQLVVDFMNYYFTVSEASDTPNAENTLLR